METPEQEAVRVRAEVAKEMEAEESGETQVVDAASTAKKTEHVDPWEGVNPALKQAFDNMSQRVGTLQVTESRLKQAESRIGAITNELHVARTVKATPTAEQMQIAAASDEKWESLKKDFPEWAEAFDGRFDQKITVKLKELREELKTELKGEIVDGKPPADLDLRFLNIVKPKWKAIVASTEWKEWLALQPQETAALVRSDRAEDAISIITAFEETGRTQKTATEIAAERKQRMRTAVIPQGGKATPVKSEADMSAAELRANIGEEVYAET